jgi:hypothetical protein
MHVKGTPKTNFLIRQTALLVTSLFLFQPAVSQETSLINLEEISQKKVRKYIVSRDIDKLIDFSSLQPSCKKGINTSDFNTDERTFLYRNMISNVWNSYRFSDPMKSWEGRFVRFGLLISKTTNKVFYPGTSTGMVLDTGQVCFLNLRLLKGLFKLPVAFEIINIDPSSWKIEYSYLAGNIEKGKQMIQLFDAGENRTRVVHTSYFRSEFPFRDDVLYPYFHKKIIRNFHKKMRRLDNRQKREFISITSI